MSSTSTAVTAISALLIALAVIASATVVVVTGHIDGQTYAAIVAGVAGFGLGAGAHAAGTQTLSRSPG